MLRFGAFFGLLFGIAAVLNGLFLILYGEKALPDSRHSRVPAIDGLFDIVSDLAGSRAGFFAEGAAWLLAGLTLAVLCADATRPFLPRRPRVRQDGPLRDPVSEAFAAGASRLARLKGLALVAAVAVLVAALSLLLLNGA